MKMGYILMYVTDVAKTMDFYQKAFLLEKGFYHESGQYGEMVTGETKLGFVQHDTASSHGFDYQKFEQSKNPPPFEIGFISDDVDESFNRAVKEGGISVLSPTMKPWGQKVSYIKDCNGALVEICSSMES